MPDALPLVCCPTNKDDKKIGMTRKLVYSEITDIDVLYPSVL